MAFIKLYNLDNVELTKGQTCNRWNRIEHPEIEPQHIGELFFEIHG